MKRLASADAAERAVFFGITARAHGFDAGLMEKDFWVCWTLQRLFSLPDIAPHLIFKGGTTLSKVYGVIRRFSEDIDISVSRDFVRPGSGDIAEEPGISKTRRRKEIDALVESFHLCVANVIKPALEESIAAEIGDHGWTVESDTSDCGTLHFVYPAGVANVLPYVRTAVKIEMGGRSDIVPSEHAVLRPYAADDSPEAFVTPDVGVQVLGAERTFWEKATILHSEFHRPDQKARASRISRHYYDLVQLARHPQIGPRSLTARDILHRVVEHKTVYFADSWSRYDEAASGALRLLPPQAAVAGLRQDYEQMRPMFFDEPPSFDSILEELARLEAEVNEAAI